MPKALINESQSCRYSRSKSVENDADIKRNLLVRLLLRSPKDTLAGAVMLAAIVAIITNVMFMQAARHPASMFNVALSVAAAPLPAIVPENSLPRLPEVVATGPRSADPSVNVGKTVSSQSAVPAAMRPPAPILTSTPSDPVGDLIASTGPRHLKKSGHVGLRPRL